MKAMLTGGLIWILICLAYFIGYIMCIVKAVKCDWSKESSYKAEAIYTGAAVFGVGGIVGWFNIDDTPYPVKAAELE